MTVTTPTESRTVYRAPRARTNQRVLDHLDVHCRRFIALSPFCVLSSADAAGRADAREVDSSESEANRHRLY